MPKKHFSALINIKVVITLDFSLDSIINLIMEQPIYSSYVFYTLLLVLDISTGISFALETKSFKSSIMRKSLHTHLLSLFSVTLIAIVDLYANPIPDIFHVLYTIVYLIFSVYYVSSIIENLNNLGIWLPSFLVKGLDQMKDDDK